MPWISRIILVVDRTYLGAAKKLVGELKMKKVARVVAGGVRRQDSVANGVRALGRKLSAIVLIHDSARPFPDAAVSFNVAREALRNGASLAAVPGADTIKRAGEREHSAGTVPRAGLWLAQTPQAVRANIVPGWLKELSGRDVTDDVQVLEDGGVRVKLVRGSRRMFKVTDAGDLEMARAIAMAGVETRAGFGFDLHKLVAGRPLILGGVRFPYPKGLDGHSDADIVCHSLCDAIMGAAGLGDMGARFGVRRAGTKGMSSLKFLAETASAVREAGWRVRMADATLMIQEPRIAPRRELMRRRIAEALGTSVDRISVKATTAKHSGPIGAGEAMACFSLVTLAGRPKCAKQ
jgi:2-C-methyl-D-erythritol 4-phosphate cytidylyltransferase/2-C-methyl-D-erythritol 2,4-cyclodiphosphate synthase